jgi:hypothetical protein
MDLGKLNLFNIRNGGMVLGSSHFFTTSMPPDVSKYDACLKMTQKNISSFILIHDARCSNQRQAALVIRELFNCDLTFSQLQNSPKR